MKVAAMWVRLGKAMGRELQMQRMRMKWVVNSDGMNRRRLRGKEVIVCSFKVCKVRYVLY